MLSRMALRSLEHIRGQRNDVHDEKSASVGSAESGRIPIVHVALLRAEAMWVCWMTYIEVAIACFLIKCMAAHCIKD
jgi:hypothetical protein